MPAPPPTTVQTVLVPLASIHPSEYNPRYIRDERFLKLRKSLRRHPDLLWDRPVLVQASTRDIYAGEMRFHAAVAEGWTAIPARVNDITEAEARKVGLVDNVHGGEWQEQELAEDLAWLVAHGIEMDDLAMSESKLTSLLDSIGVLGDTALDLSEDEADAQVEDVQATPAPPAPRAQVTCPHCGETFDPDGTTPP